MGRPPKEENSMKRKNVVQEGFSEFIKIVNCAYPLGDSWSSIVDKMGRQQKEEVLKWKNTIWVSL